MANACPEGLINQHSVCNPRWEICRIDRISIRPLYDRWRDFWLHKIVKPIPYNYLKFSLHYHTFLWIWNCGVMPRKCKSILKTTCQINMSTKSWHGFFVLLMCKIWYKKCFKFTPLIYTPPNFKVCARRKFPARYFKICHLHSLMLG